MFDVVNNLCTNLSNMMMDDTTYHRETNWLPIVLIILILASISTLVILLHFKAEKKRAAIRAEERAKRKEKEEQAFKEYEEIKARKLAEQQAEAQTATEEQPVADEVAPIEQTEVEEKTDEVQQTAEPIAEEPQKAEKKPTSKKAVKKAEEKPAEKVEKPTKKLNGKWTVEIKRAGEYVSKLTASNGEVMLYSETYTTEDGARNGIATIIKGIESGKVVFYQDKNSNYYFKIKTSTNRLICVGEIYKSKDQCVKAAETVKRIAAGSTISSELVEGARYIEYTPAEIDTKKTLRGKWKIETVDDGKFSARLYASNGQLMLATEEVANRKTAENAIESVKKNALEGNFIIDRDKFGRFYYKLRNVQRSVICIGEAYESLDSCVSAIESVRRFATTSQLVADNVQ